MLTALEPEQESSTGRQRPFVRFALPGPNFGFGALRGAVWASRKADVAYVNSGRGWDDMNVLWVDALNDAAAGGCTHFAMLHSDIVPEEGWLDILLTELETHRADLVSAVVPIKDKRGLTSCGIGDVNDPWNPFRRFTMREIMQMPETFTVEDTEHPDRYLLHNTGCWCCDLRNPVFRALDDNGELIAFMNFPLRVVQGPDGQLVHQRESEDWFFSRQLHRLGVRTLSTRKVSLTHQGSMDFPNSEAWGLFKHDEDTRQKWEKVNGNGQG